MSSEKSAFLTANPKGENESWEEWGDNLAKKYKTPSDAPNLPFAPGYEKLRASFPILSSSLIDSDDSIFPYSRDLGGIWNPVEGSL